MDWQGVALVITSLGTLIASIGAVIVSVRNSTKVDKANEKLEIVHQATNGLTERLERASKESGRAIGVTEGIAQQVASDALVQKGRTEGGIGALVPTPVTVANPAPVPVVETKETKK